MNAEIKLDPESLRALIGETLREEIRAALVDQLDHIVAGEMAKMKLFKPGSSDLATMITNKVDNAISRAMGQEDIRDVILTQSGRRAQVVADKFEKKIMDSMRLRVVSRLKKKLEELEIE